MDVQGEWQAQAEPEPFGASLSAVIRQAAQRHRGAVAEDGGNSEVLEIPMFSYGTLSSDGS